MDESIGGACKHNGDIGDKETVAVELYSSPYFKSLHVAKIYIHEYGRTIRVWYTKLYHTLMVQNSDTEFTSFVMQMFALSHIANL